MHIVFLNNFYEAVHLYEVSQNTIIRKNNVLMSIMSPHPEPNVTESKADYTKHTNDIVL